MPRMMVLNHYHRQHRPGFRDTFTPFTAVASGTEDFGDLAPGHGPWALSLKVLNLLQACPQPAHVVSRTRAHMHAARTTQLHGPRVDTVNLFQLLAISSWDVGRQILLLLRVPFHLFPRPLLLLSA